MSMRNVVPNEVWLKCVKPTALDTYCLTSDFHSKIGGIVTSFSLSRAVWAEDRRCFSDTHRHPTSSKSLFAMEPSDVCQAYYRLGTDYALKCRRKSKLLGFLSALLGAMLVVFSLLLLFNVLRPTTGQCWWPTPGSRCFWPLGRPHQLVLISMDGFRHDYLELVRSRLGADSLPNFARLEAEGVRANRSINAFPTITMPNHHTLVTGLYPQDSGVVGNEVFDKRFPNKVFSMGDQKSLNEAPWLDGWPEPIWVTLQRKGGLAGSLLWPLTDNFVNGDLPFQQVSQFTTLDGSVRYPYTKRVKDLLWWLDNPRYRIDLVLAYFDEPDETGHAYGPESKEVAEVIVELDKVLGQLLDGLEARDLRDKVDIILTADHGMTWITRDRVIVIDDLLDPADYSTTEFSSVGLIYPKPGMEQSVYRKLRDAHPHLNVYWLSETPFSLHFNHSNSRMPPIVLIPDPLWHLTHKANDSIPTGNHGYSPEFSEMNPFLIASGPSFRRNEVVAQVHAVDIYTLMCGLLQIRPNPHNGSFERIAENLLKPDVAQRLLHFEHWPAWFVQLALELEFLWLLMALALLSLMVATLGILLHMQRKFSRLASNSEDHCDDKEAMA
ncbi:ectonucleotide pyrophosphatase/phosphodiesterase family member 5 [Clonorchis sinensis]|uniref:Ectonucleotide pyrophosphatase/phosphodiesterase family member 5 n=1 Tax=Clonorchis sinensis TaxID=79923 RepID=G7Y4Y0_CLOSI|nr:ectonucleotide pyrophosphatase/phosphodiesterase family member 5 [Clonorchis sinensis]